MVPQAVVFEKPPSHEGKRIPMRIIRALVRHIARNFDPVQIILFGSYAYGKPERWSDIDLLVVKDIAEGKELETALEISRSLPRHYLALDVIVRSPAVIERRKALGDWFLREITAKGKVMYERNHPRMGAQGRQ